MKTSPSILKADGASSLEKKFNTLFSKHKPSALFANMHAEFDSISMDGITLPCTVVNQVTANCFNASPHALMIDYAKDELVKLPRFVQLLLSAIILLCSGILRLCQIDRIVTLNNQGLSTNMPTALFMRTDAALLTQLASDKWHTHQLAIRSLNDAIHADFIKSLKHHGWQLLVTRQVYLMHDWQAVYQKINTLRDKKLLSDGKYYFKALTKDSTDGEFMEAKQWYDRLYLHKYSRQNVQFTTVFLKQAVALDILSLHLLYDANTHQSVAVVGVVVDDADSKDGFIQATVPVIGYDDNIPTQEALYRRCMAYAMQHCAKHQAVLNFSSGAPSFKRLRGAAAQIEYMAVYTEHLPYYRRLAWRMLTYFSQKYYAALLTKYKL